MAGVARADRHKLEKTVDEVMNIKIEFATVLTEAVGSPTLSSVTHVVTEIPVGTPVVGIVTSSVVNGTAIEFTMEAGTDGVEYLATFDVTLNDGQVLQECVEIFVTGC